MKSKMNNNEAMSDHQGILDNVRLINKQIEEYNKENDFNIFENLKELYKTEKMTVDTAKMYRNMGMYHFYINNYHNAVISMQLAIDILRCENRIDLIVEYYSELGYMHYNRFKYLLSRKYYDKTEELINQVFSIDRHIVFLHYYRYGLLLSNMQEYPLAELKFEKALLYAENDRDVGLIIMNIGLLFKRKKDFKAALRYYSKSLYILDDRDLKIKSKVYNYLADVYKILGQHRKALSYMDKAFKCIKDDDMSLLFTYFNTYTEIKLLMGDRESVMDRFLELLLMAEDFHIYKEQILEGISNMIVIGSEDSKLLLKLEDALVKLIERNLQKNREYVKELKVCLGNIQLCLRDLKQTEKIG